MSVSEISTEFKIRFLNLWILRCAQYDKQKIFVVCLGFWVFWGVEFWVFWGGILLNLSVMDFFGVCLGFAGIFVFDEQK